MPETDQITPDNNNLIPTIPPVPKTKPDLSKLTPYEIAAVTIKQANPTMTKGAIGRALKDLGLSKNEKTIYSRLRESDYLNRELAEIENNHREHMLRITYPKAEKVVDQALDSKRMKLKEKFPFAKLAYDKVHGETHKHVGASAVNVENIERLQVVIGNDLENTLKDTQISSDGAK
jgi:hypothetical protein